MGIQETRLERTARYLENEALDGLIAVNYGHNSFLESHAVFALTGVRPIGESALVVDRAGGSTLIVTRAFRTLRRRSGRTICRLRWRRSSMLSASRLAGRSLSDSRCLLADWR